jgi:hypothetical protein
MERRHAGRAEVVLRDDLVAVGRKPKEAVDGAVVAWVTVEVEVGRGPVELEVDDRSSGDPMGRRDDLLDGVVGDVSARRR